MIDEQEIKRVNRRANRWLALYLVLIVATLASIAGPWWLTVIAFVSLVTAAFVYQHRSNQAWDAMLDAADDLGLKTWKHKHYRGKR